MAPTTLGPITEESKAVPATAPASDVQIKTATGTEMSRREMDDVRSSVRSTSLVDTVTKTATNGNDHHHDAHSNFQVTANGAALRNQKAIDEAWAKGTELSKEYGQLLGLDRGELDKPQNAARKVELEKQLKTQQDTVGAVAGVDHPITSQFAQQLQITQDRERSKVVADKLWSMTTEAEMFKGLSHGRDIEKGILDYKERNKDLFGRSSAFAEEIKNQEQKARDNGSFTRKNMEDRFQEISSSLDHWHPDKADVSQKISSVGGQRNFDLIKAIYREQHPQKGHPELLDLVKDKCGANSDAARSFSSKRGEYHFAHRVDDARAEKLFTGVSEAELDKDPRFAAAKQELDRLRHAIQSQKNLIGGNERDAATHQKEYDAATAPGLTNMWLTVSGARGSMLQMSEASQTLANQQISARANLERDLAEQTKRYEGMIHAEATGRKLQEQGKVDEAQALYNKAQTTFTEFAQGSGRRVTVVTREYAAQQNDALNTLAQSEVFMANSETALRATQKVCVVAGATVATIATAGAGAPLLTAALVGTGAGATISATSHGVEAVGDVGLGNKTIGDAAKYATWETLKDTKDSAVAAVSTASGIGVAKYIRGGAESVTLLRSVAAGSGAGATAAGVTTTVSLGGERLIAEHEFSKSIEGKNLTPEQQLLEKTKYMSEHGLTGSQMLTNGAISLAVGTVSGGIGGGSAHVSQKIAGTVSKTITTNMQQLGIRVTEHTANTGMALGAAYVQGGGHLDLNNTIQIVGNAAVTDGLGRSVVTAPKAGATTAAPAAAPHETATVAAPAPKVSEPAVTVRTQQSGTGTTVTVSPAGSEGTVQFSMSQGRTTTTGGSGVTITVTPEAAPSHTATGSSGSTTTIKVNQPDLVTAGKPAGSGAPAEGATSAPKPEPIKTAMATEPQQPALPPGPKEIEISAKLSKTSEALAKEQKMLSFLEKSGDTLNLTPEQVKAGMASSRENIAALQKDQIELAQSLESERTTQKILAKTRQENQERSLAIKLENENAQRQREAARVEAELEQTLRDQNEVKAKAAKNSAPKNDQQESGLVTREAQLSSKLSKTSEALAHEQKMLSFLEKSGGSLNLTPEQVSEGIASSRLKITALEAERAQLSNGLEAERAELSRRTEQKLANDEKAAKMKLAYEIEEGRRAASRAEAQRAEILRNQNRAQAIAEGRLDPVEALAAKQPPSHSEAPKPAAPAGSGSGSGSSPSPGGTKEVLVAKVTTEESLQRTVDGKTVSVQKQKVVYVAQAEAEESPHAVQQRAALEKLLNSAPKEAPVTKTKLSHADEQIIYRDLEAKNPAAADELFVARRNSNGKFLTREDVLEVCAKHKIEPPESIQPKAPAPEVEVTKAPKERETVEAKKSQSHTDLPDESIEANYFEIRQAAEHNQKLAAKLDALHDTGEFTASKVAKAFKDAHEEIPEIVADRGRDSEFSTKPWSPDNDESFSPSRDNRGGTATKERTSTRVQEETETQVATRTKPAVETEEQTQTRVAPKTRVVEEEQTQTRTAPKTRPVEEEQTTAASPKPVTEEQTATATRTTSKTRTDTETEPQTQLQPARIKPPVEPPPPPQKRRPEDDGGIGNPEYHTDPLRRHEEELNYDKRRIDEDAAKRLEHSVKHDWIEDKSEENDPFATGRKGRYEDRGF